MRVSKDNPTRGGVSLIKYFDKNQNNQMIYDSIAIVSASHPRCTRTDLCYAAVHFRGFKLRNVNSLVNENALEASSFYNHR